MEDWHNQRKEVIGGWGWDILRVMSHLALYFCLFLASCLSITWSCHHDILPYNDPRNTESLTMG